MGQLEQERMASEGFDQVRSTAMVLGLARARSSVCLGGSGGPHSQSGRVSPAEQCLSGPARVSDLEGNLIGNPDSVP